MASNFGRHSYEYFSSELAYFAQGLRPKVSHSILVLPLLTHAMSNDYERRLSFHSVNKSALVVLTIQNPVWPPLSLSVIGSGSNWSHYLSRGPRESRKKIDPKTKDWRRYFVSIFRLFHTLFLNKIKPHILNTIPLQGILRKYMSLHVHNLVLNGFRLSQTTFSPFSHLVFHFPLPRIYA